MLNAGTAGAAAINPYAGVATAALQTFGLAKAKRPDAPTSSNSYGWLTSDNSGFVVNTGGGKVATSGASKSPVGEFAPSLIDPWLVAVVLGGLALIVWAKKK